MNKYIFMFFLMLFGLVPSINAEEIKGHVDSLRNDKINIRFDSLKVGSVGDVATVTFIMIDGNERIIGRWELESVKGLVAVARPIEVFEQPGIGQPVAVHTSEQGMKNPQKDNKAGGEDLKAKDSPDEPLPSADVAKSDSEESEEGKKGDNISRVPTKDDSTIKINPEASIISGIIKEWINNAEPVKNARGADLRFDKWGRVHGRAIGGIITLNGSPDDTGGRSPERYVWDKKEKLDSVNHCTLGEYVRLTLNGEGIGRCKGRYQNSEDEEQKENDKDSEGKKGEFSQPETVTLPDVVGMGLVDAMAALEEAGLSAMPEVGSRALDSGDVGKVEVAFPAKNGELSIGDQIILKVFDEAVESGNVPSLIGMRLGEAARVVKAVGLNPVFELGDETENKKKDGTIYRQTPAPGTEIAAGKDVTLMVYTLVVKARSVPNLKGMRLKAAQETLKSNDLSMTPYLEKAALKKSDEGKVYKQNPEPGEEVTDGAAVNVWVYGDYEEVNVPIKENIQPATTANEHCSLGKSSFIYDPNMDYFVFRNYDLRTVSSTSNTRDYLMFGNYGERQRNDALKIQREGKMELILKGQLKELCPHLRENCSLSSMNHSDGSFFGDICGKWDNSAISSSSTRSEKKEKIIENKIPNLKRNDDERKRRWEAEQRRKKAREEEERRKYCEESLQKLNNSVLQKQELWQQYFHADSARDWGCKISDIKAAEKGQWRKTSRGDTTGQGRDGFRGGGDVYYDPNHPVYPEQCHDGSGLLGTAGSGVESCMSDADYEKALQEYEQEMREYNSKR